VGRRNEAKIRGHRNAARKGAALNLQRFLEGDQLWAP
jgi:hypothetical protein